MDLQNQLEQFEKMLYERCGFRGKVVLGGSIVYGESCTYSDKDIYIVTKNIYDAMRLLRQKQTIITIKKELDMSDHVILLSRGMLAKKLWYIYGHDNNKHIITTKYDKKFVAITSIKIAYRALGNVLQETNREKQVYMLGKSLLHAIYANKLRHDAYIQQPLFSIKNVYNDVEDEVMKKILHGKLRQDAVMVSDEDIVLVKKYLDEIWCEYRDKIFSYRAWFVRMIFAIKQRQWKKIAMQYDRYIIEQLKTMIEQKNFKRWDEICRDVMQVLYI